MSLTQLQLKVVFWYQSFQAFCYLNLVLHLAAKPVPRLTHPNGHRLGSARLRISDHTHNSSSIPTGGPQVGHPPFIL